MKHITLYLLVLLAFAAVQQVYSLGYYMDKNHNVKTTPLHQLPLLLKKDDVMGVATFLKRLNTTGWNFLQVSTNKKFEDYDQMYAAGFLEGYITAGNIWDAWNNFNQFMLNNDSQLSPNAQAFVNNQTAWLRKEVRQHPEDNYWELVNATFNQIVGMHDGYISKIKKDKRADMNLTFDQFYYLTNMGDLEDIIPAYNETAPQYMECSALVKLTKDDLIVGHNTFNIYSLMLRIFKSLTIPLKNPLSKVETLMFSSRPGDLNSKDDFYVLDNGIVVIETSLNNFNRSLYNYFSPKTVPNWLRNLVANRMAYDVNSWAEAFFRNRSGTHNNQWIIVDYNMYEKYKHDLKNAKGIVSIVEEFFNLESAIDVTQTMLVNEGYVGGYNVPYNQSIYNESAYDKGYGFNYTTDPRAILFKKYADSVKDMESAKYLIRLNNVTDTNDICSALAPRCDLLKTGPYIFGAIDGKVTNSKMVKNMMATIISGPTTIDHPPFDWKDWKTSAHRGMPEVFDFDWLNYKAKLGPISGKEAIPIAE